MEQAALCYIRQERKLMRKYAFHMILAGHRFSKSTQVSEITPILFYLCGNISQTFWLKWKCTHTIMYPCENVSYCIGILII